MITGNLKVLYKSFVSSPQPGEEGKAWYQAVRASCITPDKQITQNVFRSFLFCPYSSTPSSRFYHPEVSQVQFVSFFFSGSTCLMKNEAPPNRSTGTTYNAEWLITCKCRLPSFGRRRLKHTSSSHSFKVFHGIIVFIELCISSFSGLSNSKLECNTLKIKVCKALWTFFSVSVMTCISLKSLYLKLVKYYFVCVQIHSSGYLIIGWENKWLKWNLKKKVHYKTALHYSDPETLHLYWHAQVQCPPLLIVLYGKHAIMASFVPVGSCKTITPDKTASWNDVLHLNYTVHQLHKSDKILQDCQANLTAHQHKKTQSWLLGYSFTWSTRICSKPHQKREGKSKVFVQQYLTCNEVVTTEIHVTCSKYGLLPYYCINVRVPNLV